jgi:hypothetical protein
MRLAPGGSRADRSAALREVQRQPVWLVDVCEAREVSDAVGPRRYLHAGPPIATDRLTAPSRGAVIAGLLLEGQAESPDQAQDLIERGEVELVSCNAVGAVGAMAGLVTPGTPVVVVERQGRRYFAPLNEGLGTAIRFGDHDPGTLDRLRWLARGFAPVLRAAIRAVDPVDVVEIQAEGLRRGDDAHNRNPSSTANLVVRLAAAIVEVAPRDAAVALFRELAANPHFFLCVSMAAGKAIADALHEGGVPGIVTAMSANGREIGLRVSGASEWFLAEAVVGDDIQLLDGFTLEDASPPVGDSIIVETIGLGAFALSAAPSLGHALGLSAGASRAVVDRMRRICLAESERYVLPQEDLRGTPFGIEVAAVLRTGIEPVFSMGYAHRELGKGRVGAGLVRFPLDAFERAAAELGLP